MKFKQPPLISLILPSVLSVSAVILALGIIRTLGPPSTQERGEKWMGGDRSGGKRMRGEWRGKETSGEDGSGVEGTGVKGREWEWR